MKCITYRMNEPKYSELKRYCINNKISIQRFIDICIDNYLCKSVGADVCIPESRMFDAGTIEEKMKQVDVPTRENVDPLLDTSKDKEILEQEKERISAPDFCGCGADLSKMDKYTKLTHLRNCRSKHK